MFWIPIIALSVGLLTSDYESPGGRCVGFISSVTDSIPVIGHIKGVAHYVVGDSEGGEHAMIAATRTSAVIGGGIVGSFAGPVGMVAGGIAGGAAVDSAATATKSSIEKEYSPVGYYATYEELKNNPTPKTILNAVAGLVLDGFTGLTAGVVDSGPEKLTRTQWRRVLRKNAKARAAGLPVPHPSVHVSVKSAPSSHDDA